MHGWKLLISLLGVLVLTALVVGCSFADAANPPPPPTDTTNIQEVEQRVEKPENLLNTKTPAPIDVFSARVAYWPGNGDAKDVVGENDGTLHGDVTFALGVTGQAFSFDGDGDFVQVADSPSINIRGDVTVALWAKKTVSVGSWTNVLAKGVNPISYRLAFSPSNHLAADFQHDPGGGDVDIRGPQLGDSLWHHYAYVRNGNTHQMFVDGAIVKSAAFAGMAGDSTGLPLLIGVIRPEDGARDPQFFGGLVDEVMIFDRALDPEEIQVIYQGKGGSVN